MLIPPHKQIEAVREAVRTILTFIGEDPTREGLAETPTRVLSSWLEMTRGYHMDPKGILAKQFELDDNEDAPLIGRYDQMIVSGPIPFVSHCEHHMMPFEGNAWVGYVPSFHTGKVVGLSKIARLVDCFALRLQVQERMTQQIADAMHMALNPAGVIVVVKATHACQKYRGIKKSGMMTTSAIYGVFKDNNNLARQEFFELVR